MKKPNTFEEVLEGANKLSPEEQDTIIEILRRRLIERRRNALIVKVNEARKEYKAGRSRQLSSEEIIKEILS